MSKECILPVVSFCVERSIFIKRLSAANPPFDIRYSIFDILRFAVQVLNNWLQSHFNGPGMCIQSFSFSQAYDISRLALEGGA
jgi:hypothetical protein